jgi:hypothetical protein
MHIYTGSSISKMNFKTYQKSLNVAAGVLFFLLTLWLSMRSKPEISYLNTKSAPENVLISSELTTLPDKLCFLWTSTRDNMLRRSTMDINLRYIAFNYRLSKSHYTSSSVSYLLVILLLIKALWLCLKLNVAFHSTLKASEAPTSDRMEHSQAT